MKSKNSKNNAVYPVPQASEKQIRETLMRGHAFMDSHIPRRSSRLRLFVEQAKYLSPPLWLSQLFCVAFVLYQSTLLSPDAVRLRGLITAVVPLLSLIAVPELTKDIFCNMSELERCCKNSGASLFITRLASVGCLNVLAIALCSGIIRLVCGISFLEILLCGAVSYTVILLTALFLTGVLNFKHRLAGLGISGLSCLCSYLTAGRAAVFFYSTALWCVLLALLLSLLIFLALRTARKISADKEVYPSWN